jgi:hypothetical protein
LSQFHTKPHALCGYFHSENHVTKHF